MRMVWCLGLIWLCTGGAAWASEPSKLLYSRGLVAFHAGKLDEALGLFDKAVNTDPADSYARYYRGVTRARLGNPEAAVTDLRQVVQESPELTQASLDLGIALVETQQFEEALAPLDQVLRETKDNDTIAQASLFKGIAHLRLGQVSEAREALDQALLHDPQLPAAHYYAGVVAYQDARFDAAESHFEQVVASRPSSAIGKESIVFLERIQGDRANNFGAFGAVGFQYDSNVVLATNNGNNQLDTIGVSRQDDGRATINVGGYYLLGRNDWARLTVGSEFYQSLHFQLHQFDLTQFQPMGQLEFLLKPFRLGTTVRYDYYLLEWDDFLRQFQIEPYTAVDFGSVGELTIFTRILRRDFLKPGTEPTASNPDQSDPDYRIRDGWNFAPGMFQSFNLFGSPLQVLTLGYQYDQDEPNNPSYYAAVQPRKFEYVGHQVSAALAWLLPFAVETSVEYIYRTEHYAGPSATESDGVNEYLGSRRSDSEHHVILVATRPLTEHLRVNLGYFGLWNESNKADYQYNRQIGSIALEARF